MFGYIAPDLARLTQDQRKRYRSAYCGLCHALKDRFGQTGRLSLSNDMTFLAILLSSLYDAPAGEHAARCGVHPLRSHPYLSGRWFDFAADMNILLFYGKCVDRRMDNGPLSGRAGEKAFRAAAEKVRQRWPLQSARMEGALDRLWQLEKADDPDPDALCALSGEMLGACFVPLPEDLWASSLFAVGRGIGRFVYWMDAWEDYDADIRAGRFNPLRAYRGRPDYEAFCRETLEMLIAEAAEPFELLPLEKDLDILRNVLYSGVWQRYALGIRKRYGKEAGLPDE